MLLLFWASLMWLFQFSVQPYAPTGVAVEPGLTLAHYIKSLSDSLYVDSLVVTFKLSLVTTIFAILLGYPLAYQIVRTDSPLVRAALVMTVAIPFLTNLIVRLYALTLVLGNTGFINTFLIRMLSFILSVSAFAVPLIIGEGNVAMIANTIYDQVLFVENIPFGSALAVIALAITMLLLLVQARLTRGRYGA